MTGGCRPFLIRTSCRTKSEGASFVFPGPVVLNSRMFTAGILWSRKYSRASRSRQTLLIPYGCNGCRGCSSFTGIAEAGTFPYSALEQAETITGGRFICREASNRYNDPMILDSNVVTGSAQEEVGRL